LTLTTMPFEAMYSNVPISGPEITMALLCRFRTIDPALMDAFKYMREWDSQGQNALVDRFINQAIGPGGSFNDLYNKALEKRHGHMGEDGLVDANDMTAVCIWAALKRVAGTIASTVVSPAAKAASIGCGMIPFVGGVAGQVCGSAVRAVANYAMDSARVSTNRHVPVSVDKELKRMGRKASGVTISGIFGTPVESKQERDGEVPEDRSSAKNQRAMLNQLHKEFGTKKQRQGPSKRANTAKVVKNKPKRRKNKRGGKPQGQQQQQQQGRPQGGRGRRQQQGGGRGGGGRQNRRW